MTQILWQAGKTHLALTCPQCKSVLAVYPKDIVDGENPCCECAACGQIFTISKTDIPQWFMEKVVQPETAPFVPSEDVYEEYIEGFNLEDKESLVLLLFGVQLGKVSCRRAAYEILAKYEDSTTKDIA